MGIIGFNFTKINCERKKEVVKGSIEIKHNISIVDVEKTNLSVGGAKNDVLKIDFSFSILYGSSLGGILIEGNVIYADTKEIIDETEKKYKADKKLNSSINSQVYKFIYSKAIIKALGLSDALNLPAPVPIAPKISKKS